MKTRGRKVKKVKVEVRCTACGWEGTHSEVSGRTVYEDFGDVYYAMCPRCKRLDVSNDMLVDVDEQ